MVFLVYSQSISEPKIDVIGCMTSLDLANSSMKKKVREYIAYNEGEMKNQVACRPSVQDISENKDLKDGLYYVCKKDIIEVYRRTTTTTPGWISTYVSSEAKLMSYYMFVEVHKSVIDVSPPRISFKPQNSSYDEMIAELKRKVEGRKETLSSTLSPTVSPPVPAPL